MELGLLPQGLSGTENYKSLVEPKESILKSRIGTLAEAGRWQQLQSLDKD